MFTGYRKGRVMNIKHFIKTENTVLDFCVNENHIDFLCANKLQRVEKSSGRILLEKEIFEKDGLARILTADNDQIFVSDFCTLHAFSQHGLEPLGHWQLGTDLSSDICGMAMDETMVYCSIRNGKIITVDRADFRQTAHTISDSSMWSLIPYHDHLVCGTVSGQLLLLDKASLSVEKKLMLGKQNIRRLLIETGNDPHGDILYASAQDKKLFKIDLSQFEIRDVRKNAHAKMFDCAGIYHDTLVTISHPCSEIALWDKHTLEKIKQLSIPLKLSGKACLEGNRMYLSSRNIHGIDLLDLLDLDNC